MTPQKMVKEFHIKYNIYREENLCSPACYVALGRIRLLNEELAELAKAFHEDDISEIADALADLAYVIYGTADICGIDLDPVIAEVHRSNMTKEQAHFKPVKGERFSKPDIMGILERQMNNEQ
jgi:predicted HAD superfamily Cof-like phosphohydrolase